MQEEADKTCSRVKGTTSLLEMRDADVVIEAVAENEALKTRIFGELDKMLKPSAILASNTSSISITRLAASTQRPKQVHRTRLSPDIKMAHGRCQPLPCSYTVNFRRFSHLNMNV